MINYMDIGKCLFENFNWPDIELCVNKYALDSAIEKYYQKKWFPLFFDNTDAVILFNLEEKKKSFGGLFLYEPALKPVSNPIRIYDSIETWIQTTISCYNEGVYVVEEDGSLSTKNDRLQEIAIGLNPNSAYWRYESSSFVPTNI
jgi:hypothetical protein